MLAIVGGTGLYELPGLEITHRSRDTTPFGDPSGEVLRGRLRSNEVLFLARHGAGHRLLPHEVNYRANVFALKRASSHLLLAGGIGVTPMIAMAHALNRRGEPFLLHYSAAGRGSAGFVDELQAAAWSDRVRFHFKDEGARADLAALIPAFTPGQHLYTCGSPRYMDAVFEQATARGWPEDAMHREYFAVPEAPPRPNHPFALRLKRSQRVLQVPSDRTATEVLQEAGFAIDVKCSDGICGVCAVGCTSGGIDHRDYVLSARERESRVVMCCSRTVVAGAEIEIDL